jgi:hypothetical protein
MSVWRTNPVQKEPIIELHQWKVVEADGKRHFVGYSYQGAEGRVSSPIETYDAQSGVGRTRSGRLYQLVGDNGHHDDAEYVLERWCILNRINKTKDVSNEY